MLACSRALGDKALKTPLKVISSEPAVNHINLTKEGNLYYMINTVIICICTYCKIEF